MKKGFTLIELLAVIVILAIIALIAVPIILEIINNTKEEATIRSAENYLDAAELSITTNAMNDSTKEINGTYQIIDGGKKIQKGTEAPIEVSYDGEGLESGTITVKDGKIKSVKNASIGSLVYVKTSTGESILFTETPEDVILKSGESFNAMVKTLAKGSLVSSNAYDTIVKSIEFFSYGKLPEGYTLKELQKLRSLNVSTNDDNKIMAYYDGVDKIFIYSEGLINFNETSSSMFSYFSSLEKIIFNEIDTSQVTTMNSMFVSCNKLTSLDLGNFDTSSVTNMGGMFVSCTNLTSLDLSNFDTSSVTSMNSMFYGCSRLTSIDTSNFDTSSVTDMSSMFASCTKLTNLDLSNFDTSKVTSMGAMFGGCSDLKCIKVGEKWTTENANISNMFASCGTSSVTKDSCPAT